jgi:hypothetical protein
MDSGIYQRYIQNDAIKFIIVKLFSVSQKSQNAHCDTEVENSSV